MNKIEHNYTQKLEVINEMKRRYPEWINEELLSIKFCRNDEMVFLEMNFNSASAEPIITNLDFISNDDLDDNLFLPEIDIVDNANVFVTLDQYSLSMCVDGLFTKEAENIINDKHKHQT